MEITAKINNDGDHIDYGMTHVKLNLFCKENAGKEIIVKFEPVKDIKSYKQLKFYFGVLIPAFVFHTGDTNKSMFDAYLRDKYLSSIHEINGEQFKYIPSLQIGKNKINKEKMTWYIEQCLNELIDIGGGIEQNKIDEYRNEIML